MKTEIGILLRNSFNYIQQGDRDSAINCLKKILALDEENSDALRIFGVIYALEGNFSEALIYTNKAISKNPNDSQSYINRGNIYQHQYFFDYALQDYDKALQLAPLSQEAHLNRGNTLQSLNRHAEAIKSYENVLSLNPHHSEAFNNLGNVLKSQKEFELANANYLRSLEANPNNGTARFNLALLQLSVGNYEEGLKNYEFRWLREGAEAYLYPNIPNLKNLANLKNHHILVWSEQGFGDSIQFVRYVKLLINLGAMITLQVKDPLVALFQNCFDFTVISRSTPPPMNVNFQVPLCSLPLLFGTTLNNIPSNFPYISVNQAKVAEWGAKLAINKSHLNIGIACSGNIEYDLSHDNSRAIPLHFFEEIGKIGRVFLIQKEIRTTDQEFLNNHPNYVNLGELIHNFEDSAAIVENMDLIITVDTSLAHLAGALGKQAYLLLPWVPDWRWLLDQEYSPWYPNTLLLRQMNAGDWSTPILTLKKIIQNYIE